MKINWKELEAARIAGPHMKVLFPIMETEDEGQLAACMEKYLMLPEDVRCALGTMRCLLESSVGAAYSAYGRYSMEMFRHNIGKIPLMRLPLRFIGWGGKHNDIGPAYGIDEMCQNSADSRIFYTDEDIRESADASGKLAHAVGQASSGIADVRADQLEMLRTMGGEIRGPHWCVTFRLDNAARREIAVNGKPVGPEKGKAVFILPKTGEFDCMLGEIVHGDPDNAFILARHNYCMK